MKKWKYNIEIKHLFEDRTTPELIETLCKELIRQLEPIMKEYETLDGGEDVYYELEACIDNFEFLQSLADGSIDKEEWRDFSFYGDFEEEFNKYLEQLYDLGDETKLIWIG